MIVTAKRAQAFAYGTNGNSVVVLPTVSDMPKHLPVHFNCGLGKVKVEEQDFGSIAIRVCRDMNGGLHDFPVAIQFQIYQGPTFGGSDHPFCIHDRKTLRSVKASAPNALYKRRFSSSERSRSSTDSIARVTMSRCCS